MNINVHGKVDLQALRLGVARALVAIVPSTWQEPFGLSGIEAQACGTAVVASAVGGIPEWCIDGVTGLLAIPGDSSDLAKKIQVVLSDKPLRKSMIKQAQNHLEKHFSMEKHYIKLIEVYSNLSYAGETGSKDN
jgi:glycosyltransferase involved in cell wall biosynthesis